MLTFTKEKIMSVILEEAESIEMDEMANIENELWRVVTKDLKPRKEFRTTEFKPYDEILRQYRVKSLINNVKILSIDPNIKDESGRILDVRHRFAREDELIPDVAYCNEVRENVINPGFKLYAFDNYGYLPQTVNQEGEKIYQKFKMFIWVKEDEPNIPQALFRNLPRNEFFATKYQYKEDPQYTSETYTKKYLHFKKINELFIRDDIRRKLYSCGLPPIMAFTKFSQPITHKINDAKYSAPNYNFLLSGIWPASSVQSAMELILNYRKAKALDQELPEMPPPTHMPRNEKYRQSYAGGHWKAGQKIASDKDAKPTDKLRLWMKAIAGGELSFYIGSDLQIIGATNGNEMIMTATFSSVSENRSAGEDWADYKIEPIQPISVNVVLPIPEGISLPELEDEDAELVRGGQETEEYRFLSTMYDDLMGKLGQEILNINDEAAIDNYLMFEPEDVEMGLDESEEVNEGETPKKIKITESQLKVLLDKNK